MFKHCFRLALVSFALGLGTSGARAQVPWDCATGGPAGLLESLQGEWSVSQKTGVVLGANAQGLAGSPLQAVPAQGMTLYFDTATGVGTLLGQGPQGVETMVLMPVASEDTSPVSSFLDEGVSQGFVTPLDGACRWDVLPKVVGSNTYSLAAGAPQPEYMIHLPGSSAPWICDTTGLHDGFPVLWNYQDPTLVQPEGARGPERMECGNEGPAPASGQMVMTLVAKFNSANSGAGMLYFSGNFGGQNFSAARGVVFSR